MTTTVTVRNTVFGQGRPKIAVPLVAEDSDGLKAALAGLEGIPFDLVEFRADFLKQAADADYLLGELAVVRTALPDVPLLFTFRRAEEGGSCPASGEYYFALLDAVIRSGLADIIDIELFAGDEGVAKAVANAKQHGVTALLCNHDFDKTPPKSEITGRLKKMEEAGADICKIAVMPQSAADVAVLLDATQEAAQTAKRPLITMSMGKLGAISRLAGETFGSAVTFGTSQKASAPGQIAAGDLRFMLERLAAD